MEGDERDAFYAALPQLTNRVLGLDHAGGASQGWLNEQATLLVEPRRNLREAAALQERLLDLLIAPPAAGASTELTRRASGAAGFGAVVGAPLLSSPLLGRASGRAVERTKAGVVFDKLLDASRDDKGLQYIFFTKHLPSACRLYLAADRPHLLPALFQQRLRQRDGGRPGGGAGGATGGAGARGAPSHEHLSLQLAAWEYFLFLFCLWPLSTAGDNALTDAFLAAQAATTAPASSISAVGASVGGVLGLGAATGAAAAPPLYVTLLESYVRYFVPVTGAPIDGFGEVLLHSLAQFWLGQNGEPHLVAQLPRPPPMNEAEKTLTNYAVLGCLEPLFHHLNAHERQLVRRYDNREARGLPTARSAHAMLAPSMYHFFEKQLNGLPDSSSRVIYLIRAYTLFLAPWTAPGASAAAKAGAGADGTGGVAGAACASAVPAGAGVGAEAGADAAGAPGAAGAADAAAAAERWAFAGFIKRNYLLYARLLTSVAREVLAHRFEFDPKRDPKKFAKDLEMLRAAAAVFDHPHVLPLVRCMGEALEQLLAQAMPDDHPLREGLVEQLLALEGDDLQLWRTACAPYLPTAVYEMLDKVDKYLHTRTDELTRRQGSTALGAVSTLGTTLGGPASPGGLFTSSASTPPLAAIDSLRRSNQRALRELQSTSAPATPRGPRTDTRHRRSPVRLLPTTPRPLDQKQRADVASGHARCSALRVPYRATPRYQVRAYGQLELPSLVDVTEQLALHARAHHGAPPLHAGASLRAARAALAGGRDRAARPPAAPLAPRARAPPAPLRLGALAAAERRVGAASRGAPARRPRRSAAHGASGAPARIRLLVLLRASHALPRRRPRRQGRARPLAHPPTRPSAPPAPPPPPPPPKPPAAAPGRPPTP